MFLCVCIGDQKDDVQTHCSLSGGSNENDSGVAAQSSTETAVKTQGAKILHHNS